ncbi:MAG: FecR domain-containing protein [Rhodocyclaceae bacterium]|nr:FecR domain-containing protein [Rhodocyclaceae bacterium]
MRALTTRALLGSRCALAGLALLAVGAAQAQDTAARLGGVTGIVSVQRADGQVAVLAQGSTLRAGDVVKTERDSYARISFTDGGEVAMRPETQIRIQSYAYEEAKPQSDSLVLQFLRGGFRAVTGLIGKRGNRDAYKVAAPTATIGIRGTDYIARLCDESCKQAQAAAPGRKPQALDIVARVATHAGKGSIVSNTGQERAIDQGVPLYIGDLVKTDSNAHAVLVFTDNSRVTVQRDSSFVVNRFQFDAKSPESGNVIFELLRGGARFVTGLVGKARPRAFHVNTVTATIGVRGTGFDLYCAPKGSAEPAASGSAPPSADCNETLFQSTWDGQTEIQAGGTTTLVAAGAAAVVSEPGKAPQMLTDVPAFLKNNEAPRPDQVPVDAGTLFGAADAPGGAGLFVSVVDGQVVLTRGGDVREFQRGEAAFAGTEGSIRLLQSSPAFMQKDPYLQSMKFDPVSCLAQ